MRISETMAEYFTLDPTYEHYEFGDVKLAFRTVYNEGNLGRFYSYGFVVSAIALVFAVSILPVQGISAGQRSGQSGVFVVWLSIEVSLIVYAIFRIWAHFRRIQSKLEYLQKTGVLIEGTLLSCTLNTKPAYWRGDIEKRYLTVNYHFMAPDQRSRYGRQIRILDQMWGKESSPPGTPVRYKWAHELAINQADTALPSLPARGTPIRVLYADPETYVML